MTDLPMFATFDADGRPAFYAPGINDPIPDEAIAISMDDWATYIADQGGHAWKDGKLIALVPVQRPAPMPGITDRQFGQGLWQAGLIDFPAYCAFVGTGTIPARLLAILKANLQDDGQPNSVTPYKLAVGLIMGAHQYQFDNPLVPMVQAAQGWTDQQLRDAWVSWSKL